ncbi:MAG: protease family protein [Bacteroidota bacterium]|nr:protease family protein [Bacteroidota bacterium]
MFIEKNTTTEKNFWEYLLGSFIIILSSFIGQLPLLGAILYHVFFNGEKYPAGDQALMTFFDSNSMLVLILIPSIFSLIALYYVIKYRHHQSFLFIVTKRKSIDYKRILFSFSLWASFIIVSTVADYYVNPTHFEFNFKVVPFLILVIVGTLLIPIQTSVEELVFRGYLMQGFGKLTNNKWFPLLMTSLIFGLMHLFNPEVTKMGTIIMIYYIGTGLFLGIITLMDGGLELALGFHAANNLLGALLVTSSWTAFQTHSVLIDISEPNVIFDIIMPVLVVYPILLFIFNHKYQWADWRKKLIAENN